MSYSYNLYQLQLTDTQIDRFKKRLLEIERLLNDFSAINDAKNEMKTKQNAYDAAQKSLQEAEHAVTAQKIKIEQTESTLYSGTVKNPKELQALQQEAEALKRFLSVLEDRLLEKMIIFDDADEQLLAAKRHFESMENEKTKQDKLLIAEREKINQELTELTNKRGILVSKIPPEHMAIYEDLRNKKGGVAVTAIENQACGACGTTLTAALFQAAKSPSKIVQCSTCKRILYYPS